MAASCPTIKPKTSCAISSMHGEDSSNRGDALVHASVVKGSRLLDCTINPTDSDIPARPLREEDVEQCSEAAAMGYWKRGEASQSKLRDNGRYTFVNPGVVDC